MTNLLSEFESLQTRFPARGEAAQLRARGQATFSNQGLPTRKQEDWHYTSVKPLAETSFELALLKTHGLVAREDLRHDNPEFFNIIFINGKLDRVLSDWDPLKREIQLEELNGSIRPRTLIEDSQNFEALNWSYFEQGVQILVPPGVSVSKPVQVMNILTQKNFMTHPRLEVIVGQGSKLVLIETFSSHSPQSFQNSVCEGEIHRSARLEYVRVQDENTDSYNIGLTRFSLAEGAHLEALSFAVGAQLGRHNLEVCLKEKGASAVVNGLTLGSGRQHLDHLTLIDHAAGEGTTQQLYKSVLNHQARSVFTGKVVIREGAQKAASEQLNKNLLLSSEAEADSRPQLEILADDVKATHGSTVGQLSSEEIFYLLSRAISKDQATEMLSLGFIQDLVYRIANSSVRTWLNEHLINAYRKGAKA